MLDSQSKHLSWRIVATLLLAVTTSAPAQTTVHYSGNPLNIPDSSPGGVSASVQAMQLGLITDIDFRLDALDGCNATPGNPNAAIAHTYVGDLVLKLTSPSGTQVVLIDRRGGTRENICTTLLDDDSGGPPLSSLSNTTGQFVAGTFVPDVPLSLFDGENPNGTWILNVSDNESTDTGILYRFALIITTAPVAQIAVDVSDDPFPGGCTPGSCSLREAVNLANARAGLDRILLPASAGIQLTRSGSGEDANLTGDLDVTDELEIMGSGTATTVVTQTTADRLLQALGSGTHLTLRSLTLLGGSQVAQGGAIHVSSNARLLVEDAELNGHRATQLGGAIYHSGSSIAGQFTDKLVIRRSRLNDNQATNSTAGDAHGGAIYSLSSGFQEGYLIIEDSTITNNRSDNGGGAIALDGVQSFSNNGIRIVRSNISQNQVSLRGRGGAIASQVADNGVVHLDIVDSVFQLNSVPAADSEDFGGAIAVLNGELRSVVRSQFHLNSARSSGAIARASGEIVDSSFCDNSAVVSGGAISIASSTSATIRRSTFCNNTVTTSDTSQTGGGAIAATSADLTIERSTLVGNSAVRGGTIAFGTGDLYLRSNTMTAPSPLPPGALGSILRHTGSSAADSLNITNNIIFGQCSYLNAGINPDGAFNNIEASGNTCRLLLATLQSSNQTAVSGNAVNLGALQDNGGPTLTRLPATPSIAIDLASNIACTVLDQRGYQRTDASCDIGSVEAGGEVPPDVIFQNAFE
jgi:predicted outer membrane repeat protein